MLLLVFAAADSDSVDRLKSASLAVSLIAVVESSARGYVRQHTKHPGVVVTM